MWDAIETALALVIIAGEFPCEYPCEFPCEYPGVYPDDYPGERCAPWMGKERERLRERTGVLMYTSQNNLFSAQ